MSNSVTCPSCRSEFEISEVMAAQLSKRIRAELEGDVAKQRQAVEAQAKQLKQEREEFSKAEARLEEQIAERLQAERSALVSEAREAAKEELSVELQGQKSEVETLKKKLKETQEAELELLKRERELETAAAEQELQIARKLADERSKIRQNTLQEADQQHRLNVAEKDKLIQQMQQKIDDLKRKSEQGSQQMQGEVLELELESALADAFPGDVIDPVAKGQNGADVLQHVHTISGRACGSILWESKRTKNWQKSWLPKLRDDQRRAGAEYAVIVSEALPDGVTTFALVDGVWVCSRPYAIPLALALRTGIIEVAKAHSAAEGRHEKADHVYRYLCSAEFTHHLGGIVESYCEMLTDLDKEERAAASRFKKRRKQLDRAFTGTTSLYGDLQGLIGNAMPEIKHLELDDERPAPVVPAAIE